MSTKKTNSKDDALATGSLQTFRFDLIDVRTVDIDGEVWFLAVDVCDVLGYANPRDAIAKHCRPGGVSKRDTPTECDVAKRDATSKSRMSQEMTYINEGNLYRLIIKSRKPEAEPFEAWVCDEVLPTIRKTGRYTAPRQQNIEPKEYRAIVSKITSLTSKMTKIKDAMDHKQTWIEITMLCDMIGVPYPELAFMRKHFKQVELHGADAPYMDAKPAPYLPDPENVK